MATLSREQRKLLENTVVAARGAAERGAAKALTALGVGDRRPPESLSRRGKDSSQINCEPMATNSETRHQE